MKMIIAIACGGAFGAVSRHYLAYYINQTVGTGFPWGVLAVNILGSFILGGVVGLSVVVWSPSPEVRAFITVGFLGSLTTFSSFALDVGLLYERGAIVSMAGYIGASVGLGIGAFFLSLSIMRSLLG